MADSGARVDAGTAHTDRFAAMGALSHAEGIAATGAAGAYALACCLGQPVLLPACEGFAWRKHTFRHRVVEGVQAGRQGSAALLDRDELALTLGRSSCFPRRPPLGGVVGYGMLAYMLMRTLPIRWHLPRARH